MFTDKLALQNDVLKGCLMKLRIASK